jgi:hypothetical protein
LRTVGKIFGQIGSDGTMSSVLSTASLNLCVVTWSAIGVSLIRGVPNAQAPSLFQASD